MRVAKLIEVNQVSKAFVATKAVDGVSLAVEAGEVVGLIGANGAGKTTLIRMILGLIRPDSGTIGLFDESPSRAGRARLGYVPQNTGLYPDLTVAENLAFTADAFGVPRPGLDPELEDVRDMTVSRISLGLRKRTAFAAAFSHRPELLLLDEPTSGVGPLGRAELWGTIGSAASDGTGVLVTTHYMEEAEQCDRVVMLAAGRTVAAGTAADIVGSTTAIQVVADDWRGVFQLMESAGLHPTLVGTHLRVTGVETDQVESILSSSGVHASVREVKAGFEEAFVALSTR